MSADKPRSREPLDLEPAYPTSREEWSDEIQNVAAAIYCGTPEHAEDAIGHVLDSIMSAVSEVEALRAEVEGLMEVAKFYANDDTYHIDILGACGLSNDMDEWGQFGKMAKKALEAIEKARQPK